MIAMIACYAMIFIDESGIAVTLAYMQQDLNLTNNVVHWVINSYLLVLSILLLLGGKLSDLYGKRRIFTLGIIIFVSSSFLSGCAQNGWMMLIGRFIQGIGASFLMPCVIVLIHRSFSADEFGKSFGLILGTSNLFYATAPFIAGLLTEFMNWRFFFWINIPVGMICLIFTFLSVEKDEIIKDKNFYDLYGLITFIVSLTALVFAIMQGAEWDWTSNWIIGLFIVSIIGLYLFVRIELATRKPLLDIRLFKIRNFSAGNIVLFCSSIAITVMVFLAIWLQTSVGFSPATVGIALLPASVSFIFIPALGGAWRDRSGPRAPILAGTLLIFFGLLWITATLIFQNYFWILLGLIAYGLGIPLVIPNSVTTVMTSVKPEQSGMASGTFTTIRQCALSMGIAILSAVITSYNELRLNALLKASDIYANISVHQVNLLLTGESKNIDLNIQNLSTLKNSAQLINTQAFVYGMSVMVIFSAIGLLTAYFFIKKQT